MSQTCHLQVLADAPLFPGGKKEVFLAHFLTLATLSPLPAVSFPA